MEAEAENMPVDIDKPFVTEMLMLLDHQFLRTESRLKAIPLRDFKIAPKDKAVNLYVRPTWPYQLWFSNVDGTFEPDSNDTSVIDVPNVHRINKDEGKLNKYETEDCSKEERNNDSKLANLHAFLDNLNKNLSSLDSILESVFNEKILQMGDSENEIHIDGQGDNHTEEEKTNCNSKDKTLCIKTDRPVTDSTKHLQLEFDDGAKRSGENRGMHLQYSDKWPQGKLPPESHPHPATKSIEDVNTLPENVFELASRFSDRSSNMEHKVPMKKTTTYCESMTESENKLSEKTNEDIECSEKPSFETALKQPQTPSHMSQDYTIPISTSSAWYGLTNNWLSLVHLEESDEVTFIKDMVLRLITKTLDDLKMTYNIFIDSYVTSTGSMAENTRILRPDEFDFMVVIPYLADPTIAKLSYSQMGIEVLVDESKKGELFEFINDRYPPGQKLKEPLTVAILLEVFKLTVQKHLTEGWEYLAESENHSIRVFLKHQTGIFHLSCNTHKYHDLQISVDVCFCLPLDAERIDEIKVCSVSEAEHLHQLKEQCCQLGSPVFAVLNANPLVCGRFYFLSERDMFRKSESHANCYRLAKYVTHSFLPKVQKNDCSLCIDSIIPSFYLKTIMFYLMEYYTDPKDWDGSQLGNRLIEVFDLLRYSFKIGQMSYFMVINSMKLDHITQYDPAIGSLKLGYSLQQKIVSCQFPEAKTLLNCEDEFEVLAKLHCYWEYMLNISWTIPSLLEQLVRLLDSLSMTEMGAVLLYKRKW